MAISYNRLWKQLIAHGLSKTDMKHRASISTNVLAHWAKENRSLWKVWKKSVLPWTIILAILWNLSPIKNMKEKTHDYRRN